MKLNAPIAIDAGAHHLEERNMDDSFSLEEWLKLDAMDLCISNAPRESGERIDGCRAGGTGHTPRVDLGEICTARTTDLWERIPEAINLQTNGDLCELYNILRMPGTLPAESVLLRDECLWLYNLAKEARLSSMKAWQLAKDIRKIFIMDYKTDPDQGVIARPLAEQETSDSYDTDDDYENEIRSSREILQFFHRDHTRDSVLIGPMLQPKLRKDIRAWARLYKCGCMTLHDKTMLIHKDKSKVPRRPRKCTSGYFTKEVFPPSSYGFTPRHRRPSPLPLSDFDEMQIWKARSSYDSAGCSSAGSRRSSRSRRSLDSISGTKRLRLSREEGGFPCTHADCCETFNRQCDLSQHERCHLPYEERPHSCYFCPKRFLWPKDLRRHENTHLKTLLGDTDTICGKSGEVGSINIDEKCI